MLNTDLLEHVRVVPDFPRKGIQFYDITTILADPVALEAAISQMLKPWQELGISHVAAIDARGFLFAGYIAKELGVGIIPIRKKGKLPYDTYAIEYDLEYGSNTLEMHIDALSAGDKVLIVDDLLATGGTALAAAELIQRSGANIAGLSFFIELMGLPGRANLESFKVHSVLEAPA